MEYVNVDQLEKAIADGSIQAGDKICTNGNTTLVGTEGIELVRSNLDQQDLKCAGDRLDLSALTPCSNSFR